MGNLIIGKTNSGYTIVEALIFIAVSATLFITAMTAIGGRQQEVQFTQAVRGFDSQLRDIMNDVSTGFFPSIGTVECQSSPVDSTSVRPSLSVPTTISEDTEQGTSDNCVFVGKVLQFGPDLGQGSSETNVIRIYTLVGRRSLSVADVNIEVKNIGEANPVAIAPSTASPTIDDYTQQITLDWGLQVTRVIAPGIASDNIGAVGIFNAFGGSNSSGPITTSQDVDFAVIDSVKMGFTAMQAVDDINLITNNAVDSGEIAVELNPNDGVILCLSDPDNNQRAMITLSSDRRRLSSQVTIDGVDPACIN